MVTSSGGSVRCYLHYSRKSRTTASKKFWNSDQFQCLITVFRESRYSLLKQVMAMAAGALSTLIKELSQGTGFRTDLWLCRLLICSLIWILPMPASNDPGMVKGSMSHSQKQVLWELQSLGRRVFDWFENPWLLYFVTFKVSVPLQTPTWRIPGCSGKHHS